MEEQRMSQATNVLEPFAVGVGLASLVLNMAVIFITVHQLRQRASLGLKMVLAIAAFDLLAPITGVIQEALSLQIKDNIMSINANCQILGAVHSIIPFMSTTSVAIVALERCLHIHERSLRPRTYLFIALVYLTIGIALATLTAYSNGFELTPSRIACNMSPRKGFFATLYFYVFLATLIFNCIIIIYCYTVITLLGFKPTLTSQSNIFIHRLESVDSDIQVPTTAPIYSPPINTGFRLSYPQTFALRAIIIMTSYLVIIAPCIFIMIHEAYTGKRLSYVLSSLFVMLLFSFTLINPILLILLHTSISAAFSNSFRSALKKINN